jgi:hypothetical protein
MIGNMAQQNHIPHEVLVKPPTPAPRRNVARCSTVLSAMNLPTRADVSLVADRLRSIETGIEDIHLMAEPSQPATAARRQLLKAFHQNTPNLLRRCMSPTPRRLQ